MRNSHRLLPLFLATFRLVHGSTIEQCNSLLHHLQLPNTTVYETSFVIAGTNVSLPDNDPSCALPFQVVDTDLCRVSLLITTERSSDISLEAWLPLNWSGRFLGTGNGGMNGCIKYDDLNYGASQSFATIGTNNGHNGTSGLPFYNNPGVLEDYVYRAVHLEAELGKKITEAFYGTKPTKAYYLGCSTGGRQGFKEAQDFPADFDGIVAGAPAFDLNGLMYWTGQLFLSTGTPNSTRFLSAAEWDLVYGDVLRQCDGLDGVEDGVIEDPNLCQYRPEALICKTGQSENCLSGEQVATVRAIFSPVYGSKGDLVHPRLQPGANATERLLNGEPHQYPMDWFRYAIYSDPSWDPANLNPHDWETAQKRNPFNAATWEGDLSDAKNQGAKILHYHGLEDNAISSENSARYYDHVSRTMGASSEELDEFYRYFRISGLAHCEGGNGASMIGGNQATFTTYDAEKNVLAAIVRWVEEGIAPDYILGTKLTASGDTQLERRHCRYPRRNVYKGTDDSKLADSWECL